MLRIALMFLVVALIAGLFGFGGIAEAATGIAVFVFYIFIALFLLSLLFALIDGRRPPVE